MKRLAPSPLHAAPLLESPLLGAPLFAHPLLAHPCPALLHHCLMASQNCQKHHQHDHITSFFLFPCICCSSYLNSTPCRILQHFERKAVLDCYNKQQLHINHCVCQMFSFIMWYSWLSTLKKTCGVKMHASAIKRLQCFWFHYFSNPVLPR